MFKVPNIQIINEATIYNIMGCQLYKMITACLTQLFTIYNQKVKWVWLIRLIVLEGMLLATAAVAALCLLWVRVKLLGRAETQQEDMTLVRLAPTK